MNYIRVVWRWVGVGMAEAHFTTNLQVGLQVFENGACPLHATFCARPVRTHVINIALN